MKIVQLNKIAGLASLALGLMVSGQSANATTFDFTSTGLDQVIAGNSFSFTSGGKTYKIEKI